MAIDAVSAGFEYLTGKLRGDATLDSLATGGVWDSNVPRVNERELVVPSIVMLFNREVPTKVISDDIVYYRAIFIVKCVNVRSDQERTVAIVNRIATVLHQSSGSVTNAEIIRCQYMNGFSEPETFQAAHYDHRGAFWELTMQ